MEKYHVSFVAISQALCNNDREFVEEVYRLLTQHILLGKISAGDLSFLTEQEYAQKFGDKCAQPIFVKKETLLAAMVDNATSIPFISAYQNFFRFASQIGGFDAMKMVIDAYRCTHEKIFYSMCRQFILDFPKQDADTEQKIFNALKTSKALKPFILRRLSYLDNTRAYEWNCSCAGKIDIEIADYLLNFTQVTRSMAADYLENLKFSGCDEGSEGQEHLISVILCLLQTQTDTLTNFRPIYKICKQGMVPLQESFRLAGNMLQKENIANADYRNNFLRLLKRHMPKEYGYDALEVYGKQPVVNDRENINLILENICTLIHDNADYRLNRKKALPIIQLALSALHSLLCQNNISLNLCIVKEFTAQMDALSQNDLYNVSHLVEAACFKSADYDVNLLCMINRKWPLVIKKLRLDSEMLVRTVYNLTKKDLSEHQTEVAVILEEIVNNNLPDNTETCNKLAALLTDTPFEELNFPDSLKDSIRQHRNALAQQRTFLRLFIP